MWGGFRGSQGLQEQVSAPSGGDAWAVLSFPAPLLLPPACQRFPHLLGHLLAIEMIQGERPRFFLCNGLLAPAQLWPNTGHSQELPDPGRGKLCNLGCKAWFYFSWGSTGERQLSDWYLPVAWKGDVLV